MQISWGRRQQDGFNLPSTSPFHTREPIQIEPRRKTSSIKRLLRHGTPCHGSSESAHANRFPRAGFEFIQGQTGGKIGGKGPNFRRTAAFPSFPRRGGCAIKKMPTSEAGADGVVC